MSTKKHIRRSVLGLVAIAIAASGIAIAARMLQPTVLVQRLPSDMMQANRLLRSLNDNQSVTAFVHRLVYPDPDMAPTVGDHQVIDLDNDGRLELIATLDFSERRFFNTVLVVSSGPAGWHTQELTAFNEEGLSEHIVDIDGDGTYEISVTRLLGPYLGARPTAMFTDIYECRGGVCIYSSASPLYQSFYTSRLSELDRALTATRSNRASLGDEVADSLESAYNDERSEIERLLK